MGTAAVDVLHYDLALSWTPATTTLRGTATVQLRPVQDRPDLRLDFQPYTLDAVILDGATVPARVSGHKLVVAHPVTADHPVTLVVRYHGRPAPIPAPTRRGDFDSLGLTVTAGHGLWTMQEPYGASTWYPVNDTPSDKALYDIAVTVPTGWSAVASGTPAGRTTTRTAGTFRYRSTDPVASYLTTLAVDRLRSETARGPHGVPITYWYPAADAKLLPTLRRSPQFLAFLEQRLGPYPFPSAGVVLVPSNSGMETAQMVTLGDLPTGPASAPDTWFDGDLLHEYAHQWFGDTVTPTTWQDLWLNEGWAMYLQLRYEQQRDHATDAQLLTWLQRNDQAARKSYGPPGRPDPADFGELNVYASPAYMLYRLNQKLGDTAFWALARDWVQQHRNTNQDRRSFIAFVNARLGHDETALITAWLDGSTAPTAPF